MATRQSMEKAMHHTQQITEQRCHRVSSQQSSTNTPAFWDPQDKLRQALTVKCAKASKVVKAYVEAPTWSHKFVIGCKGVNIRQITQDHPKVHVEFQGQQGSIKLEGPPEEVVAAIEKLEFKIAELQRKLCFDQITVNPMLCKHIIGRNGSNISRIRNDTGVSFNITEVGHRSLIHFEGSPDGVSRARKDLEELVAKFEKETERRIIIDCRFHGVFIGTKGVKIKEIRDKFNVRISFPNPGEESDIVKIRGAKDDVDQCYTFLRKMLKELNESNYQVKISVFRQFYKYIIGKGGANIRKIREETSTRIELPSEGQKSNEITITGKKEDCEKACEIIKKIQDDLIVEVNIYIPVKLHKSLIGPRGKLLRHVSEECGGVDITFPPPDITSDKVTIRGPKEEVHRAEVMLEDLSNEKQLAIYTAEEEKAKLRLQFEGAAPILDPEIIVDTLTIDPGYHQHFLSWRGEVLPQIRDECIGVTISFPRLGLHDDKVTFRGLRKYVERAKDYIQEMVNNLHGLTLEVIIPQIYHDFLQGVRGSKVQALATKFKVYIRFPEKDRGYFARGKQNHGQLNCKVSEEAGVKPQDIVRITGQEDRCKVARDALLNLVPVTVEENIAFRHHRFIIGQNFKNILNVMTEFDVNIQMPKPEDQSNIIKIVGSPANIQHAREALREKVCYLENKESIQKARIFQSWIEKDSEYNKVIRKKRCLICKIRGNCKCRYQFPPRTDAEEHITIEKLNKMINSADIDANIQFRHFSKISCKMHIGKQYHRFLIGNNGVNIHKIQCETGARIIISKNEDKDTELIIITGIEDAIEEAKRQLKAIFEEIKFIVEDTVTVAVKHHRHFISRRCEVLRQISDQYGGVIISFPWSGVQRDKVTIKGAREYVEGAKARIMEIVNDLEVNLEVIIPQKHHHFLLGVQGSKVHALSTKFKVQIRFPKKGSISLANGKQSQGQINGKVNEKAGVRPQDIVHITGQKDRCEAARDALLNLVPVTVEENITYGFLLFITGKKGKNAFRIMTKYNVVIFVPQYGSNIIKITGSPANTECARQAIREKMHQLKEEESDQKAGSFRLQVEVDPEYHPRIIGKIENKHNVTIQFPPFSDVKKNIITITGFKKNVHDANAAILALTREWHKMVTHTIQIDSRLYYLVRGQTVKKVMEKFKVEIRFPRGDDSNTVVIMGTQENIDKCRNLLFNMMEEYKQNITDEEDMEAYKWLIRHRDPSMVVLGVKS